MKMHCLGSSSEGNCYLLRADGGETLLLEAGVKMSHIKRAVDWRLDTLAGAVVSHRHQDHARAVPDLLALGVPVLAPADVHDHAAPPTRCFCRTAEAGRGYRMGAFKVYAFAVQHDVPCMGYVIDHPDMGRTLFVTDAIALPCRFSGLRHVMIECNYSDAGLDAAIADGVTPPAMRQRLLTTHMELGTTIAALRSLDLAQAAEVVLLHMSDRHGEPERFKAMAEAATGRPTHIARPGLDLDFGTTPY